MYNLFLFTQTIYKKAPTKGRGISHLFNPIYNPSVRGFNAFCRLGQS